MVVHLCNLIVNHVEVRRIELCCEILYVQQRLVYLVYVGFSMCSRIVSWNPAGTVGSYNMLQLQVLFFLLVRRPRMPLCSWSMPDLSRCPDFRSKLKILFPLRSVESSRRYTDLKDGWRYVCCAVAASVLTQFPSISTVWEGKRE